ncbi:hypothetical protein C8Q70DRAFT_936318 [Cubamyces menziesii]|nr:hypothetical protein C8Q70DRAFT_936318 [Cubamyces menziesii]
MAKQFKPPTTRIHAVAPQCAQPKQATTSSTVEDTPGASTPSSTASSSTWRTSTLWAGRRINKTRALKEYRLQPSDLEGLVWKVKEKYHEGMVVNARMYKEQDVERKAWERHGGPEGFETYLQKLYERHVKAGKNTPFVVPVQYAHQDWMMIHAHSTGAGGWLAARREVQDK